MLDGSVVSMGICSELLSGILPRQFYIVGVPLIDSDDFTLDWHSVRL